MIRYSNRYGRLGLVFGALVWVDPILGLARPRKRAPIEAKQEAEELQRDYERLYKEGKYAEAIALAERACSILEQDLGQTSVEFAVCINNLGLAYSEKGAYEKSEPLHEQALAVVEEALGPRHPDVAVLLNNLSLMHFNKGAYGEAEPLYERALAIHEQTSGPHHLDVAMVLNNLALLHRAQGAYGKAESLLERALAIFEKASDSQHPEAARILNNLAELYRTQGMYRKAEPLHERALAINEKELGPHHPVVATSLNNLANLYRDEGAYERAEPLYERALAIYENTLGPHHPYVARNLNNLALLYRDEGAYEKAEPLYERALFINEEALGPHHLYVADSLISLANLYREQEAYGKAEPLSKRALAINEKISGSQHPHTATSLNNLANLYRDQGMYGKAIPLYKRALAIFEEAFGPHHPLFANSLNNLADVYREQAAYGKAGDLYERALAIREKTLDPHHPRIATNLNKLAELYHEQGKHNLALNLHRRTLEIQEANLARTLTVADESRKLRHASILSDALHYILSLHLRVTPKHDAIAELALTTLLRRKSRVQDLVTQSTAALRRSLPKNDQHLLDDLSNIDSRIAVLSSRGPDTLTVRVYSEQLDELRQQRDRLWSELAKHSALVGVLDHPVVIEDVQLALSAGTALVEFVQYEPRHDDAAVRVRKYDLKPPPRYAAYVVFPDRFDWVDLGPATPTDKHIKTFRRALQTKQAIPIDLYDAIMRPIVEILGSTHRMVIAPAGALSLVPFGALHDGERYLIENYDLRYVTTGRDLLAPPAAPPVTTTPVTVVANPTGAFLTDAEAEADFLEGFFPDTRVLLNEQATETNVRTVERPLILHMATHGFFGKATGERDNPMLRSGLHLADIEQVQVDWELDDGQLTAYEVSGMDLRGTQLVVLSACETGMGAVDMGEGVFGLRRAFAMAGARTTVMSLWEVSGVRTQTIMEAYYRKLAEGLGRGEAMQAVQLKMLRSKEHTHPKDWAAFIVSGDDDPIDFPAGQQPRVVEQEPPQAEDRGCCATKPSGRGAPVGSMLVGLLGLTVLRRQSR